MTTGRASKAEELRSAEVLAESAVDQCRWAMRGLERFEEADAVLLRSVVWARDSARESVRLAQGAISRAGEPPTGPVAGLVGEAVRELARVDALLDEVSS